MKMIALALSVGLASHALAGSSPPLTQPGYQQGLSATVYKMPRVPLRVRKLLPGQTPDAVDVLQGLEMKGKDDLGGLDRNIQADYVGEFHADVEGVYAFEAESDDGIEFYLDGQLVLKDAWVNGDAPPARGEVALKPGWHPIRVAFYQGDGGLGFHIKLKSPGANDFSDVPQDALRMSIVAHEAAERSVKSGPTTVPADAPWRSLYSSRAFGKITEDEAELLVDLLEGPTAVSLAARRNWSELSANAKFDALPYWQQSMVISGFLRGWLYGSTPRTFVGERAPFTLSEPEKLDHYEGWRGADRSGYKHVMTFDGDRRVEIFTPEADSPERDTASKAVASLPPYLRKLIRTIMVEPLGTASEFNGGGGTIWIRLRNHPSQETLDAAFAHEVGHLLMHRTNCYTPWEAARNKDVLSISEYGRQNPSEDFAEFVRLYIDTNEDPTKLESLRTLYPNRMKVMDDVLGKVK